MLRSVGLSHYFAHNGKTSENVLDHNIREILPSPTILFNTVDNNCQLKILVRPGHDVKLHRLNIVIDDVARGVQSVMQSNRVLGMTLNRIV